MMRRRSMAVLLMMLISALPGAGCSAPQPTRDGAAPADLEVTLGMSGEGQRYTWFELRPDRTLGFSGGIPARQHITRVDLDLTQDQVDAVWRVIVDEGLLTASSAKSDNAKTRWELAIRSRRGRAKVRSVDDAVPGIVKLHDLLFGYQAQQRYELPGIGGAGQNPRK